MVSRSRIHHDVFSRRMTVLAVFLLFVTAVIIFKLFVLEAVQGALNRKLAEGQYSIYKKLLPSRGEIELIDPTTLQPTLLATNVKQFLVYAVPQEVLEPQLTADSLATVLSLNPADILPKLTDKTRKYVPLKKKLTDDEQAKVTALKLPGIYFDSEDTRIYPQQTLLSQTLGFVGYNSQNTSTKVGLYGLEKFFQKDLSGLSGNVAQENDPSGAWMYGSNQQIQQAQDGKNLILTIDKSIQFKAESLLSDTVTKNGADSGCVIVEDPKTGAILAIASYPNFDPNQFNLVTNASFFSNEAVVGNYEPGSIFKAITMAAAIDESKVQPSTTYTDTGSVVVGKYTIKNAEGPARGTITLTQALDQSLNTGAIFAENQLGNQDFYKYLQAFGFGLKTGIELPEAYGSLDNLKGNNEVNFDTASFGQGITVTPMQMVQAYATLANGGKMMKPYIVESSVDADGNATVTKPQQAGQPVSAKTANTVTAMLVDVVENGLGKKAAAPGYYIAGKTGTAQIAGPGGKYLVNDNIGTFVGFGPVEDPQFVMLVRIDHPRDVSFAESTAAPAWGQLAQFILSYDHISPTRPTPTNH